MLRRIAPGALFSTLVFASPLLACGDKDDDGGGDDGTITDGGTDGGTTDGGTTDGGTTEPEPINATISGTVRVQLYDYQTGDEVSWEDYGDTFPFGGIFVGAYEQPERGGPLNYRGDTSINPPSASADGDAYSMPVQMDEDGTVRVYAALDWDDDRVIGTDEPRGLWTSELEITDGAALSDIDLTIVAPVNVGGGGGCDVMEIRGEILLTATWADGDVAAMTTTVDGEGPLYTAISTPTVDGGGASADYTLTSCANEGERRLVGVWDKNGNDLFDPTDMWGSYVSETDVDGNPIDVGSATLSGHDIQIPFGDGAGLGIVPFVTVGGDLTWSGGAFDDLPDGTTIYAMALKFRPEGETVVADTEAYDMLTWEAGDYAGLSSLPWEILVPANSVVFLWFDADVDGDGVVNEAFEPVGSLGTDTDGRFPTGTSNSDGYSVELASVK